MITIQQLVFYFFATLAVIGSSMVIISKNSVRAVLYLVFTFFCMAGIWLLLQSEFLAIVLVLVYVGAVMVLFLFVVMMLDIEIGKLIYSFAKRWPIGLLVAAVMLGLTVWTLSAPYSTNALPNPPPFPADYSHVKVLGALLYTDYLFAFEVAGVILLVAMIAAIGITFRGPRDIKTQKPSLQVQVRKEDRLKIVKMLPEGDKP